MDDPALSASSHERHTRQSKRNGTNRIIARFYFCVCESSLHISEMKDSASILFPVLATVAFPMTSVYVSVMVVAVIDYDDQGYGGEKKTSGAQREGFVPRRTTARGAALERRVVEGAWPNETRRSGNAQAENATVPTRRCQNRTAVQSATQKWSERK